MNFKPIVRFAVVSDIHYRDEYGAEHERMEKALKDAYAFAETGAEYKMLDALYVVGDFATRGSEIQMQAFKKTLDEGLKPETRAVLSLASHEFMCEGGEAAALERFDRIFSMQPDTHLVFGGYHFISITSTKGCHFDDAKQQWAAEELKKAEADAPKRPIFFFQHPHITDTVYGSINWGEDELTPVLMNYPQIIDFSGHSHAPINDPRSIHQRHFTCLGTGSLSYFELDEFDKTDGTIRNDVPAGQMYFVEADEQGRVRIYPYDIISGNMFREPYAIDTAWEPSSFIYTDERRKTQNKPFFPDETFIEIGDVTADSALVTFGQAKIIGERVNDYKITVRRKSDGAIVKQLCRWSDYFVYDMPERLSQKITGLNSNTAYTVEITAGSFWKCFSEKPLTASFSTKS